MSKFTDAGHAYLPGMYQDGYFPGPLVDRVMQQLEALVVFLEERPRSLDEVQVRCDVMTDAINDLQDTFAEHGSELETGALADIATTLAAIFTTYGVELDLEDALRNLDW